jgi:excisionase family DNA binding protein
MTPRGSLGLGGLLVAARAVEAVRAAIERGDLGRAQEPTKQSPSRLSCAKVEPLASVEEVANLLQLKASTIRAYAERGSLPCVRVGGRLRFRPSDVISWIDQRRSKGGS